MLHLHMRVQVVFGAGLVAAVITRVSLLPSVSLHVLSKVPFTLALELTVRTLECQYFSIFMRFCGVEIQLGL